MLGGEVDKMDEQRGLLCILRGLARAMLFYGSSETVDPSLGLRRIAEHHGALRLRSKSTRSCPTCSKTLVIEVSLVVLFCTPVWLLVRVLPYIAAWIVFILYYKEVIFQTLATS